MDIIYLSYNAPKAWMKTLVEKNTPLSIPAYKFNDLIIKGLQKNGANVCVPTDSRLKKAYDGNMTEDVIMEDNVKYYILPQPKGKLGKFKIYYKFIAEQIKKSDDAIILCDVLYAIPVFAGLILSKITKAKIVGIVTDLPQFLHGGKSSFAIKAFDLLTTFLLNKLNGYVLLTEEMKNIVNKKGKPFIVMEGLVDSNIFLAGSDVAKADKKICLYAGALHRIYGIESLIKGFLKADIPDAELHIYGAGNYSDELTAICEKEKNIKYFGVVPNETIIEAEKQATILINPRPTNEEFTKYSFPSKNMEYMLSGTPVLTTNLPGMPKEYLDYVYIIKNETVDGMAEAITKVLSESADSLGNKGKSAQEFVLKNKSNISQTKRILELMECL